MQRSYDGFTLISGRPIGDWIPNTIQQYRGIGVIISNALQILCSYTGKAS
jgi:hypothetical protein